MTECVVVTRGGWGDVWYFPTSADEAKRHPLVQFGDSILEEPSNIFRDYFLLEIPKFLHLIGDEPIKDKILGYVDEQRRLNKTDRMIVLGLREGYGDRLWQLVVDRARPLPTDPDDIIDQVRRDRDLIFKERTPSTMAKKDETPAAAPKEKKEQLVRGHAMTAIMTFGVDKEGKALGPKNNPKRDGSASAARYAFYKPGKPLSAQIGQEGGPTLADLQYDSDPKRNWIVITDK